MLRVATALASKRLPFSCRHATAVCTPLSRTKQIHFHAQKRAFSATMAAATVGTGPYKANWNHSMIRVKDPKKSLAFYTETLGMTYVDRIDFPQWKFTVYFVQSLPKGEKYSFVPGSDEAHAYLWSNPGVMLELTHNHGTEEQPDFKYHPGNAEKDGFGHLAMAVPDVYAASAELEAKGVVFKKKPDEGRMKGIAFVYDPDGYWVELVERAEGALGAPTFTFAQTMLRVKDPKNSVPFYTERMGMTLVRESHYSYFSLFFLASMPEGFKMPVDPTTDEAKKYMKEEIYPKCIPVLELTHNHGTETQADFAHFNGNAEPRRGFGHVAFVVDDVYACCEGLEKGGVELQKKPDDGGMKGLAFARDPDGYWVELLKRGFDGKF